MSEMSKDRSVCMTVLNGCLYGVLLFIELFLLLFVVPAFGEMFCDFGARLPWPTQVLLDLSGFLKQQFFGVFPLCWLLIVGSAAMFLYLYKTRRSRAWVWCLSVVLFQVLLIGVTIVAMYAPLFKMVQCVASSQ